MCIRYESCLSGARPNGITDFNKLANICNYMVLVDMATVPGSCMPCEANPLELLCRCKKARKEGMCHHILVITHVITAQGPAAEKKAHLNLKFMNQRIGKMPKNSKGGRPKNLKHCLIREDSSDEEENGPLQLEWHF